MKNYIVNATTFIHRGRRYGKGDLVALSDDLAAGQLEAKNVIDPTVSTPKSEAK